MRGLNYGGLYEKDLTGDGSNVVSPAVTFNKFVQYCGKGFISVSGETGWAAGEKESPLPSHLY